MHRAFRLDIEGAGPWKLWDERLSAMRAYLERCKESGTLPMTNRGRLNRSAVLREFAPDSKSILGVLHENPAVRALVDEYDVIQGDERYSPYKYDALEGELKDLLDRDEFELAHTRRINKKSLARRLGVRQAVLSSTPKLDASSGEAGASRRVAAAGGDGEDVPRPRSGLHQLGSDPVLERAWARVRLLRRRRGVRACVRGAGRHDVCRGHGESGRSTEGAPPSPRLLTWLAALPESSVARRMRDGQPVDQREFVRVALLYQQEATYDEIRDGRNVTSSRFAIIEKLGEAGSFRPCSSREASTGQGSR